MGLPYVMDSRRLTGASMLLDRPGAVLETRAPSESKALLLESWAHALKQILSALGMAHERWVVRDQGPTQMLACSAPLDLLLPMTYVLEQAWQEALTEHCPDLELEEGFTIDQLAARMVRRSAPRLNAIERAAKRHGVLFLLGEEDISLGQGAEAQCFELDDLPLPDAIDWDSLTRRVPIAMITGTNGKTTTARILARILSDRGWVTGFSCTDYVQIGNRIVNRDDYSGPTGARLVLRDPEVEAAVLETARGGMLRRGVQVDCADVVVVTNVADDHLGDGGIHNLAQLAECKFTITRGLRRGAPVVVNSEDRHCARWARNLPRPVIWFGLQRPGKTLAMHRRTRAMVYVADGWVVIERQGQIERVLPVADIPLTFGGYARHNVANVLAAVGAAFVLKVPLASMKTTLARFGSDADDNPGRANLFHIHGAQVLADYGHNPEGLRAVFEVAAHLKHERLLIAFGQAGDRTDSDIRGLADAVAAINPDRVLIKGMEEMLRGRAVGEIPRLMRKQLGKRGIAPERVLDVADDREAVTKALAWLQPGDLALLFIHVDKQALLAELAFMARSRPGA